MNDVEIVARELCDQLNWDPDHKLSGTRNPLWTVKVGDAKFLLRALTANGRAKIVRREPTVEMIEANAKATISLERPQRLETGEVMPEGMGVVWRAMYEAAPAFSDQDEAVPVKTPERSS
jgi:hypothetical protein